MVNQGGKKGILKVGISQAKNTESVVALKPGIAKTESKKEYKNSFSIPCFRAVRAIDALV